MRRGMTLDRVEAAELAVTAKALADPTRIQLLARLAVQPSFPTELEDWLKGLGTVLNQSTVSQHLGILAKAGLISRDRLGVHVACALLPSGPRPLADFLREVAG